MPDGRAIQASENARLSWSKLRDEAREYDILPNVEHNVLIGIGKVSGTEYYTLFMPGGKGVQLYD